MSDEKRAIERFKAALRVRTDWPAEADGQGEGAAAARAEAERRLGEFQDLLAASYPAFHAAAERIVLNPYSAIYRWPGAERDSEGGPALLLSHYDVVPAEKERWTVDPFGAEEKDGFIWARGTIDTKNTLIAVMEAAEEAAAAGFRPKRDVWFSFGGDEERSGASGAAAAAAYFAEKGIRFDFLLDEGSAVTDGIIPGTRQPLALIGLEEKGFLDIELSVAQKPGHSSRPPKVQAVAVLGKALHRLSKKPFPWKLIPSVEAFFTGLSRISPFPRSVLLSRPRALGPLFFALAGGSSETAAMMRTTVAMTMLEGSKADNVLPSAARAIVNLRLLPGWTVESAVDFVKRAIGDPRVQVSVYPGRSANDPIPVTEGALSPGAPGWSALEGAVTGAFPGIPVLPYLVTATTDSRHYRNVSRAIYRFSPLMLTGGELSRMHGHDERVSVENFLRGIRFYRTLISKL